MERARERSEIASCLYPTRKGAIEGTCRETRLGMYKSLIRLNVLRKDETFGASPLA
jgi:hypothetical protein